MRYDFIQNHREAFPVSLLCQVLEEGRSGLYAWLKRPASPRARENRRLVEAIKACITGVARPMEVHESLPTFKLKDRRVANIAWLN